MFTHLPQTYSAPPLPQPHPAPPSPSQPLPAPPSPSQPLPVPPSPFDAPPRFFPPLPFLSCNCMQAHASACKRMPAHASACQRMQAHASACKRCKRRQRMQIYKIIVYTPPSNLPALPSTLGTTMKNTNTKVTCTTSADQCGPHLADSAQADYLSPCRFPLLYSSVHLSAGSTRN
jgi:hypothetical protein